MAAAAAAAHRRVQMRLLRDDFAAHADDAADVADPNTCVRIVTLAPHKISQIPPALRSRRICAIVATHPRASPEDLADIPIDFWVDPQVLRAVFTAPRDPTRLSRKETPADILPNRGEYYMVGGKNKIPSLSAPDRHADAKARDPTWLFAYLLGPIPEDWLTQAQWLTAVSLDYRNLAFVPDVHRTAQMWRVVMQHLAYEPRMGFYTSGVHIPPIPDTLTGRKALALRRRDHALLHLRWWNEHALLDDALIPRRLPMEIWILIFDIRAEMEARYPLSILLCPSTFSHCRSPDCGHTFIRLHNQAHRQVQDRVRLLQRRRRWQFPPLRLGNRATPTPHGGFTIFSKEFFNSIAAAPASAPPAAAAPTAAAVAAAAAAAPPAVTIVIADADDDDDVMVVE